MSGGRSDQLDVHRALLDMTNRVRALEASAQYIYPWGYWSGGTRTISGPVAAQDYPINMTVFATDEAGTYGLGAGSGPFAGFNGPEILKPGVYRSTHSYVFTTATAGDVLGCHYGSMGFGIMPRFAMAGWTTVHYQAAVSVDDPLEQSNTLRFQLLHYAWGAFDPGHLTPIPAIMIETAYSLGGHSFTVDECQVLIERLGDELYKNPTGGNP